MRIEDKIKNIFKSKGAKEKVKFFEKNQGEIIGLAKKIEELLENSKFDKNIKASVLLGVAPVVLGESKAIISYIDALCSLLFKKRLETKVYSALPGRGSQSMVHFNTLIDRVKKILDDKLGSLKLTEKDIEGLLK